MRYPSFLKKNGCIKLVAPSFGCTAEPYKSQLKAAIEKFTNDGYKIIVGENVYKDDGIGKSTNPLDCGKELTTAFSDSESDIVYSVGGGETMCEDLEYVDFDVIKNSKPKWYLGYSDNTNMTFTLNTLCDTASIYSPCFPSYGMKEWDKSLTDTQMILKGETSEVSGYPMWELESLKTEDNPFVSYNKTEMTSIQMYNGNSCQFSGRLIGGCLDCLINLIGTKFDKVDEFNERYKDDGIIWFLESCDLNMMGLRRAMWQMKNASWFKYVKGFLIGRPLHYGEEIMGMDRFSAVTGVLKEFSVPIILDCDIGHLPPMMPIVSGAYADVSFDNGNIKIKYIYK